MCRDMRAVVLGAAGIMSFGKADSIPTKSTGCLGVPEFPEVGVHVRCAMYQHHFQQQQALL